MVIDPLVSVMRLHDRERAKSMVSPDEALAMALRSEPTPESSQFVTLTVLAPATWAGATAMNAPAGKATEKASMAKRASLLMEITPRNSVTSSFTPSLRLHGICARPMKRFAIVLSAERRGT